MNEAIAGAFPVIIQVIVLLISVSFHEFFHAASATLQGDRTPGANGRLTINPIAHIDPIGSILVPGVLILLQTQFLIGWAKPVPFNPYNLKNQRWGPLLVGIAGPFANILLCIGAALAFKFTLGAVPLDTYLMTFLGTMIAVNIALAVFNLLPIPPLDGSHVLSGLLHRNGEGFQAFLERNAIFIFLAFIVLDSQLHILGPLIFGVNIFVGELFGIPFP